MRYRVSDPVLQFWFRFVFPHASRIVSLRPSSAYDQLIRANLDAYFGERFETLCRQALPRLYERDSIDIPLEVGEYWDQNVQIDLVGLRGDGRSDIGECRWATVCSWPAALEELGQRVAAYSNPDNRTLQGWLFSRQQCPAKEPRYRLIALEEL